MTDLIDSLTPREEEGVREFIHFLKSKDTIPSSPFAAAVDEFIEEHPDSINGGGLAVAMAEESALDRARIIDYPAAYHNGSVVLAFADGHADLHKWVDPRTKPQPRNSLMPLNVPSPTEFPPGKGNAKSAKSFFEFENSAPGFQVPHDHLVPASYTQGLTIRSERKRDHV
jgi:prepilin-type processing-associated H-X9-DG protein